MVQIEILSGKKSGEKKIVRHFPFSIGRAAQNDLQLDDTGIWDNHLTIEFRKENGINLAVAPNALASVNNQPVQNQILRNSDFITLGSVKLQFSLAPARQRSLRVRENLVWAILIFVLAAQFALLYWLIR